MDIHIWLWMLSLHTALPEQKPFLLNGYVETSYQWNFNDPQNGVTNFRAFDNRHNTFTIENAVLDAQWDYKNIIGRAALQVGQTPTSYYAAEPRIGSSGPDVWKYIQQAYAGYRFGKFSLLGGIFLSPIGQEQIAVKDNWVWSRSNLFYALPYYHTGIQGNYAWSDALTLSLSLYNGWNSVIDNNKEKSVMAQATYKKGQWNGSLIYYFGVERPSDAPEGRAWHHLVDFYVTWQATSWFALAFRADVGLEKNNFGLTRSLASALFAKFKLHPTLFFTTVVDVFHEDDASDRDGTASPIFFPSPWVTSTTANLEYRPFENIALHLQYRHDHAGARLYFGDSLSKDINGAYIPNKTSQDTLTLGATTWF